MIVVERTHGTEVLAEDADLAVAAAVGAVLADSPEVRTVGLIAPSGGALIGAWRACLAHGRAPLILHYPTPKLSRDYWREEISHAVHSAGIDLLLCNDATSVPDDLTVRVVRLDQLEAASGAPPLGPLPERGGFLQMSSGTTGHRKAIAFDLADVRRHVDDYNALLGLTREDVVVSWLPLYHDMGLIAGFLLPQIIGCGLVLLDPVEWVRRPESLWEAIERHGGTTVYMPNFAFEVMAANARPCPASMRTWISCSEPTRATTLARFAAATGAPLDSLANCWGMAENVFAVAQSRGGPRSRPLDDAEVVSCGRPIPGVEIKVVDGELWVRSPTSLKGYIGAEARLDDAGFYATGDLGQIIDGEVFLQGRRSDIVISAGRKAFLSDLDTVAAELVPESAGRIATVAALDEALGTEVPVVLVEHPEFWRRNRDAALLREIAARTGVETARAEFVPPRFITKTSSGKINRKITARHWQAARAKVERTGEDGRAAARREAQELVPWLDAGKPLAEQLDSLGLVNLGLLLARHGFGGALAPETTLDAALGPAEPGAARAVVRIASLCDGNPFHALALPALWGAAERYGVSMQYQHLCTPPLPVLLSDLVFMDWFAARDADGPGKYAAVRRVLDDLRAANVVLIDEATTLFWPQASICMVYPQLSHDFQPESGAELLALRWAGYSESHHHLACRLVEGASFRPDEVNAAIARLSDYLGVPVVRIAYGRQRSEITSEWEVQADGDLEGLVSAWDFAGIDKEQFGLDLMAAIDRAYAGAPLREAQGYSWVNYQDQPHWCSWPIERALVDDVLDRFRDIAVLGKRSSVPYLAREAQRRGVRLRFQPDLTVPDDCEAVVQTGSWGQPVTDKPVIQIMAAGWASVDAVAKNGASSSERDTLLA